MTQQIATIFGGTGFIGRYLIRRLTKKGYRVIIPTRSPFQNGFLKTLGTAGQIEVTKLNIYDIDSVKKIISPVYLWINRMLTVQKPKKYLKKDFG